MEKKQNGFTLIELIVVVTILAVLATMGFISFSGYTIDANASKILYNVKNLTKIMETRLSRGESLTDLVLNNKKISNGVDETQTVSSGAYIISSLKYEVGIFDFGKMKLNGKDFMYDDKGNSREFIFGYIKTPKRLYYEVAGQTINKTGKYDAIISGNYYYLTNTDTKGLISENGQNIGLQNGETLTGSLY